MFENRHVPRIGKYDNVLCVFEKNQEDEMGGVGEHPYYMVRRQKRLLPTHKKWIKIRYPNIIEKGICDDANAITHGVGLGPAWVKEITSVYLVSSVNFLKICLILIYEYHLKFCGPSKTTKYCQIWHI